eukprot:scaffold174_cov99-Isochrysis_galbana.AAC.1
MADVDFILGECNRVCKEPLDYSHVKAAWAGLRPLVRAATARPRRRTLCSLPTRPRPHPRRRRCATPCGGPASLHANLHTTPPAGDRCATPTRTRTIPRSCRATTW